MEPLAFAILAGLTPPDVKVAFSDERLEPTIPYDDHTDLVALTVQTFTARRAYQIAAQFRKRGIPVVMGGHHPTFMPEEALQYADAVVIGDAEGVWEQVVRDARLGRLQRIYRQQGQPPLQGLKYDRSIFQGKRYTPLVPVQYGRGCRFACDFCSLHAFYGTSVRQRPVREVVAEIEALDRKYVLLVDDNIFVNVAKTEELLRALIQLRIRWGCQVSIDVARNTRLMDLMEKSGCIAAFIGFESLDERNLSQMKKKWNLKQGDYAAAVQQFRDRGIMIYASFVFGYDYDTVDSFDAAVEFALRSKFLLAQFVPLNPMPGPKLYERLRAEGRLIFDRWWLDPDYRYGQASFHPRGMTANELTQGCSRARREFYRYASTFRRACDPKANCRSLRHLGIFLAFNLIAKREIARRHGFRFGANTPLEPLMEVP
jgi:radical SAM superfamily enzyme YgiQ (UPF0313 family)